MKLEALFFFFFALFFARSADAKTDAESLELKLPSGWTQPVSKKSWRFETLTSLDIAADTVFRNSRGTELFSSHTVEGLIAGQTAESFLDDACRARHGTLINHASLKKLCRVSGKSGRTATLQYFGAFTPQVKKRVRTPFIYVQYWTVPDRATTSVQKSVEDLILQGHVR